MRFTGPSRRARLLTSAAVVIALSAPSALVATAAPAAAVPAEAAPAEAVPGLEGVPAEEGVDGLPGIDGVDPWSEVPPSRELPDEANDEYFQSPRDLDGCPYDETPPPAVNESEVPGPGMTAPPPATVPAEPVGGELLGGCEVVSVDDFEVPEAITASGWIVADLDSGEVLAAKDPHGRYRPASTIKSLLALAVVDELDPDDVAQVSIEDLDRVEGSMVGVGPDGEYTVSELLSGLLLSSGNDAAYVLARELGGEEAALAKMQDIADELGTSDTVVTSVSGLDRPGFTSSAYDIALISRAAFNDDVLAEHFAQPYTGFPGYPAGEGTEAPDPEQMPDAWPEPMLRPDGIQVQPGFVVYNDNQLLHNFPGGIAGKTGFTDLARQTFVGAAERDGRRLVAVLLDGTRVPLALWEQAAELLEAGFATAGENEVGVLVDGPAGSVDEFAAGPLGSLTSQDGPELGQASFTELLRHYWPWALSGIALIALVVALLRAGARRR